MGLPDNAVKEARDRVRSALKNSGFTYPVSRITVNLAPADIKKTGPVYDLPVLLSILAASGQLLPPPPDTAFLGELALDGAVRSVNGVLPMALAARAHGVKALFVPADNAPEAAVVEELQVYALHTVRELADHLRGGTPLLPTPPTRFSLSAGGPLPDFADVRGQPEARRGAGDRRGGAPQPAADRPAGHRPSRCWPSACPPFCPP